MDALPNLKPADIEPYLHILETVRDSGLLERFDVDITARVADVQEQIRSVAGRWYDEKSRDLHSGAGAGVNLALPLLLMTDEVEKAAKALDKRFPEPLLGYVRFISRRGMLTIISLDKSTSCHCTLRSSFRCICKTWIARASVSSKTREMGQHRMFPSRTYLRCIDVRRR